MKIVVKNQPVIFTLLALLLIALSITGCDVSDNAGMTGDVSNAPDRAADPVHFSGPTMGTRYNVKVISESEIDEGLLTGKIEALLANINSLMSTYDPDSELSQFNQSPENTPFTLSPDTIIVLTMAMELSEKTAGAFDVTVGPVVNLWGFGPDGRLERKPSASALKSALEHVGYQALAWHSDNQLIKTKPVYVDLSAIAKGYAVDKVSELLVELGYSRFLVDIGGELKAGAPKATGRDWKVAVEEPTAHLRSIQKVFSLREMGVATSGDYRNFYEFNGERYSHAIDPRTGMPVNHSLASVSVLNTSVAYADALATSLMVLGVDKGYALANSMGWAVYFIERNGNGFRVKATDGFLNYIK